MGISEFIEKKKQMFFVARDSDKLELQKAALMKERDKAAAERREVEEVRKLQAEINDHNQKIHEARTQGSRAIAQKLGGAFKNFSANAKKIDEGVKKFAPASNKNSPFYTGGVTENRAKPKKAKQAHVHIHFGGK
jgi:hypothetical protein